MNKIDVQQTGGFPLETDTLNFMQDSFRILQQLTGALGQNFILSGCQQSGGFVSEGYVVINGEVLPFIGGLLQTKIVVKESADNRSFQNGQNKPVYFTRVAQFGTGDTFTLFSELKPLKELYQFRALPTQVSDAVDLDSSEHLATAKAIKTLADQLGQLIKTGMIMMWSGALSTIPAGWALCDGLEGRPNLLDRFVLGAGNRYAVNETGGEETHTLTTGELPNFNLSVTIPTRRNYGSQSSGGTNALAREEKGGGDANKTYAGGNVGNNQPHNNMPPYYALAYIIKL